MSPSAVIEDADLRLCAAVVFSLFYHQMLIGEGGDLGQMGDAQDLLGAAQRLELLADRFGGAASNADIDLIEDQRARRWFFSRLGRSLFHGYLKRQHYPAQLAARGNLHQRFHRLTGVGCNAVFNFIPSGSGPRRLVFGLHDPNLKTYFHRQRIDLRLGQLAQSRSSRLALGAERRGGFAIGFRRLLRGPHAVP